MSGMENTKAILLSAGQGSRLLPLTKDKPKCLLEIGGQSMLGWQIEALQLAGVSEVVVVAGFRHELVERHIGELNPDGMTVRAHYNPFFQAGDNLSTCWLIRQEFNGHCLLINGDTLFSADLCRSLLAAPERPMTVTIDRKDGYDEDDMKVSLDGHHLLDIGKTLDADRVNGEAIGMIRMLGEGCAAFQRVLDHQIRTDNGLKKWYLSAVQELAQQRQVFYHSIEGMSWGEVDDKKDLAAVKKLVSEDSFLTARAAVA
ncbi:MAG: phosphocholine cytidylyltransferase family protein [Sphingomonadales bacterium]